MCNIEQTRDDLLDKVIQSYKESDVKESPPLLWSEKYDLRLTPLVVQFSNTCWTAAPHLPQAPDQAVPPGRTDAIRAAIPPRNDILGWPDELLIDFPDFPDCTLDSHPHSIYLEPIPTLLSC
jgi:hypothetical protein